MEKKQLSTYVVENYDTNRQGYPLYLIRPDGSRLFVATFVEKLMAEYCAKHLTKVLQQHNTTKKFYTVAYSDTGEIK